MSEYSGRNYIELSQQYLETVEEIENLEFEISDLQLGQDALLTQLAFKLQKNTLIKNALREVIYAKFEKTSEMIYKDAYYFRYKDSAE